MTIRMRQRVFLILGALFGTLIWTGCVDVSYQVLRGSGRVVVERRQVTNFNGVALCMVGHLEIEIANKEGLWIEAEDNLLADIETEVVDGVLMIRLRGRTRLKPSRPIRFDLKIRELNHVVQAGPGRIHIRQITSERLYVQHLGSGQINVTKLEVGTFFVHASGSGNVELDHIVAQRCRLHVSGSGDVTVRHLVGLSSEVRLTGSGDISVSGGSVVQQSAILTGSGKFRGTGLSTSETDVMVSGSGSASVHAKGQLNVTITGGGSIRYRGNPHIVKSISGAGKLKRIR